jgi:RHS repeat-associated protein
VEAIGRRAARSARIGFVRAKSRRLALFEQNREPAAKQKNGMPVFSLAAEPLPPYNRNYRTNPIPQSDTLSQNSRLGLRLPTAALYQSQALANSNTATGIPGCLYDEGRRSRCTSKERDAETGLDYFGARYFSGAQGRFTSPDWSDAPQPIPFADLRDPQTLNLYSYVRNNPLKTRDEDGHCDWCQKLANFLAGDGWYTDNEVLFREAVNARFATDWLLAHGADRDRVNSLNNKDVISLFTAVTHGDSSWNDLQIQYDTVPPSPSGTGLRYEPNEGKHGPTARQGPRGEISSEPTNGPQVLQDSVPIKGTSGARVGVDKSTGEYVVFRETRPGTFHGYAVKDFNKLSNDIQAALRTSGKVRQSGAIK